MKVDGLQRQPGQVLNRPGLLLIGNFLSGSNRGRTVSEDLAEHLTSSGWKVITASSQVARTRRFFDMLKTSWSRRQEYEVANVDIFSGPAFLWAEGVCRLLRILGKPYVLSLHGGGLPDFAERQPARVRNLLQTASAVTSPSRFLQMELKRYRDDIALLPNSIDLQRYSFRSRSIFRPTLVWLRAFHKIYNPAMAVRAMGVLRESFPGIRLIMAGPDMGDGSLEEARRLCADLGVSDAIEFQGRIPKERVPQWIDQGQIFLNTSHVDNVPVSILEAMASGLPVVSTNVGGIPYLLDDSDTALLVPAKGFEAMAGAVERIVMDAELADSLARNGRDLVESFDWKSVLPRWEDLLNAAA